MYNQQICINISHSPNNIYTSTGLSPQASMQATMEYNGAVGAPAADTLEYSDSPDMQGTMLYEAVSGTQAHETSADADASASGGGGQATLLYDSVPETQDNSGSATMQYEPQQQGGVAASDCLILESQFYSPFI